MKPRNASRTYGHYILAGAFYLLIALLITFPLILHFRDSIVGGYGDGLYFSWLVRWYQKVIFEGGSSPFFNPMMNFPEGWNLSTTDTALASTLPGVPFSLVWGPVAGYNIAMWITFFLSGLAMYIWVHHLTKSRGAALLAGTIYAFLPYRIAHFQAGHLNLAGTAWFPLYFMGLYEILRTQKHWHWVASITVALSLGLIALSSMYYLYFTLLMSVVFVLSYWVFANHKIIFEKWFWLRAAITGVFSLPLLYLALKPFLSLSNQGGLADRSLEYASRYSASPTDFFAFASSHFLFGKWSSRILDHSLWMESSLYIGLVSLVLIVIAIRHRKQIADQNLLMIALVMMVTAFILALGPQLHWNNKLIEFISPISGQKTPIPLPAALLFKYLPFFSKMRAVMRIGFFTLIFSTLAAGLGANWLLVHIKKTQRNWVTGLLVILVLFEFFPGTMRPSLKKIEARPVDYWLAAQPASGAVVQMPFEDSTDQAQIYYTLTHHKAITGGFFNANQPPQYQYLQTVLATFPDERSISTLREYQVAYIVIDPRRYDQFASVEAEMFANGLIPLTEKDGIRVYGFKPTP